MQLDNALYAVVQVAHNLGAVAAVGLPLAALVYSANESLLRKTYLFTLAAWLLQVASGFAFGLVSYFVVGELPQLGGEAFVALCVKISCAALSILLLAAVLLGLLRALSHKTILACLAGLGVVALLSAAILRWFS